MSVSSARHERAAAVTIVLSLALLASACDDAAEGPTPELRADVLALRTIVASDPALRPIEEVERIADERPVIGARMLATGALPAARRQVARVRAATMTSPEGRSLARRLVNAYERRVRGLDQWHRYLEDAATNDADLLESITTRREAAVALVELDDEMEGYVPTEPSAPRPRADDPEPEPEPDESQAPY